MNMETIQLQTDAKHIRKFLDACDGNWHNCILVSCISCNYQTTCSQKGFLVCPGSSAEPLLLPLSDADILFSCRPDAEECICHLSFSDFHRLYHEYLMTIPADAPECPCMNLIKLQMKQNYDW